MAQKNSRHPDTIAARLDGYSDPASAGVVPPLQPSTTFLRDEAYELAVPGNSYGRDDNDQVRLAEQILCKLEGGAQSLLFSTGMAAISAAFSWLKGNDCLLLQEKIYWGTTALARRLCPHHGVKLVEADATNAHDFCEIIQTQKPRLVHIEVPSNPWIRLSDIKAIASACKQADAVLMVDATAATPLLLHPLELGADIVIHSATKAINGHSDVLAGLLTCADKDKDVWEFIKAERAGSGAILSAQSAWLLLRGLRTLPLRVERMCENAQNIAEFLERHDRVQEVWYPGLEAHPDFKLASEVMPDGSGYLLSFLVKGGRDEALSFCKHLTGIHRATSLGGTESLVEHRHTIEGELTGCPDNLIRLSVGIEDVEDLISELDHALAAIAAGSRTDGGGL